MPRKLIYLAILLLSSACAHRLPIKTPSPLLDSPEAVGISGRLKGGAQYIYTAEAELSPDVALQNPDADTASLNPVTQYSFMGGFGLGRNIDLEMRIPFRLHGKYQFVGDPRTEAQPGNFSMAVQLGLGVTTQDEKRDSLSGNSSFSKNEFEVFFGITAGYRIDKNVLIFSGAHFVSNSVSGKFSAPSRGITSQPYSAVLSGIGPNLGVELSAKAAHLRAQVTADYVDVGNVHNTFIMGGAELVVHFGKNVDEP